LFGKDEGLRDVGGVVWKGRGIEGCWRCFFGFRVRECLMTCQRSGCLLRFLSLALSLSLSLTHTHTHTHTNSHIHTTHTQTHILSLSLSLTHTHTHSHRHVHTRTHISILSLNASSFILTGEQKMLAIGRI